MFGSKEGRWKIWIKNLYVWFEREEMGDFNWKFVWFTI